MIKLFQIIDKMKIYSILICILLLTTYTSSINNQDKDTLIHHTKKEPFFNKLDSLEQERLNYISKIDSLKDSIIKQQSIINDKN